MNTVMSCFRSLQAIVEKMEPLFRVDCLLPRSLIASLNLMEVQEVIELNSLPVYVCAANLNSFLKSVQQRYYQSPEMTVSHMI